MSSKNMSETEQLTTIVAGSRDIEDRELVKKAIQEAPFEISELVSGGAEGVDQLGELYALNHDVPVRRMEPDWDRHTDDCGCDADADYCREAGFRRNTRMARAADAAIIVWDGKSGGSQDMIKKALSHDLNLQVKVAGNHGEAGKFLDNLNPKELKQERLVSETWDVVKEAFDVGVPHNVVNDHIDLDNLSDGVPPTEDEIAALAKTAGNEGYWAQMAHSQNQAPKRRKKDDREDYAEAFDPNPKNYDSPGRGADSTRSRRARREQCNQNDVEALNDEEADMPWFTVTADQASTPKYEGAEVEVAVLPWMQDKHDYPGTVVGKLFDSSDKALNVNGDWIAKSGIEKVKVLNIGDFDDELKRLNATTDDDEFYAPAEVPRAGDEVEVHVSKYLQEEANMSPVIEGTVEKTKPKSLTVDGTTVAKSQVRVVKVSTDQQALDDFSSDDANTMTPENSDDDMSTEEHLNRVKETRSNTESGEGAAQTQTAKEVAQYSFDPEADETSDLKNEEEIVNEAAQELGDYDPLPKFEEGPDPEDHENLEDFANEVAQEVL